MADAATTRNRLLATLVALLAVACVLLALLLTQPAQRQAAPTAPATTGTSAAAAPAAVATTTTAGDRQITFDAKGYGPLGDLARRTPKDPMAIGRVDAPVVLVEYSDYACPFCAVWHQSQFKQLVAKYAEAGTLRIEYRDLVIFGDKSQRAAQAGRAAAAQGRFWQFQDALFAASPRSGHPDLTDARLLGFAKTAGVPDLARFTADMNDAKTAEAVRADTQEGVGLGASSTPTFAINGIPLLGAERLETFTQIIDAAAQTQARIRG